MITMIVTLIAAVAVTIIVTFIAGIGIDKMLFKSVQSIN